MKILKQSIVLFFLLLLCNGCQVKEFEQLRGAETAEDEKAAFEAIADKFSDFTVVYERPNGKEISADDFDQAFVDGEVIVEIGLIEGTTIHHRLIDKNNLSYLLK